MNKKQSNIFSYLIVCLLVILVAVAVRNFFFSSPAPSKQQKSGISVDYDVKMRDDAIGQNKKAKTDYYMLALSWSPAFCNSQRKRNGNQLPASAEYQCAGNRRFGWVIHGLWPQNAGARSISDHPRFCRGDLPALPQKLIETYLPESPGAELLQGEWEKHGACAFSSAQEYFEKQRKLYRTLTLPDKEMSRAKLFSWMKEHNIQLRNKHLNASRSELFICYSKNWKVIDCPSNRKRH